MEHCRALTACLAFPEGVYAVRAGGVCQHAHPGQLVFPALDFGPGRFHSCSQQHARVAASDQYNAMFVHRAAHVSCVPWHASYSTLDISSKQVHMSQGHKHEQQNVVFAAKGAAIQNTVIPAGAGTGSSTSTAASISVTVAAGARSDVLIVVELIVAAAESGSAAAASAAAGSAATCVLTASAGATGGWAAAVAAAASMRASASSTSSTAACTSCGGRESQVCY
jgi:hypothetical protein